MHEAAERGRLGIALAKQRDLVDHGRLAELRHGEPGIDAVRERQRLAKRATRFCDKANNRRVGKIETTETNQVLVDRGIEVRVIRDVVDMPVNIVVHPSRRDGDEMRKVGARARRWTDLLSRLLSHVMH